MSIEVGWSHIPEAIRAGSTLFRRKRDGVDDLSRAYKSNCTNEYRLPLNVEEDILQGICFHTLKQIETNPGLVSKERLTSSYWDPKKACDLFSLLYVLVQFSDEHDEPVPSSVIPPESDVRRYLSEVLSSESVLTVADQYRILLSITDNPVGTGHLGFVSSRLMARGRDKRMYPGLEVGSQQIKDWNNHIAQFEQYDEFGYDGPGDTYYFWTNFFFASLLAQEDGLKALTFCEVMKNGTRLMVAVRRAVGEPTITSHAEASAIGYHVGLATGKLCQNLS